MAEPTPQAPANYRLVPPGEVAAGFRPCRRLAWIWVYSEDPANQSSRVTHGTGVFPENDLLLTCAHIFALNTPIGQVVNVSVLPARNSLNTADAEPSGGLYADTVFACSRAFPPEWRRDVFDSEWDLALVCLSQPAAPRQVPPFSPFAYEHLAYDPAFKGTGSQLMAMGYGEPHGLMMETNLPIVEAAYQRNWLEADRTVAPGMSGSPIFHDDRDGHGRVEFRLVGVISCDNKEAPQRTYGTMITDQTKGWADRAVAAAGRRTATVRRSWVVPPG